MSKFDEIKKYKHQVKAAWGDGEYGNYNRVSGDEFGTAFGHLCELIQMLEDVAKLPDEWRTQNRQSGWSFESDKGDELQAKLESK